MPQLLLFAIGAIIWVVIKALTQPPPKPPPPRQSPLRPTEAPAPSIRSGYTALPQSDAYFMDESDEPMEVDEDAEHVSALKLDDLLSGDSFVKGIIMTEVLGPPRARRPHRVAR